jgi:hypothetical protein
MLDKLKALWSRPRDRETAAIIEEHETMSPGERREADLVREHGVEGERDVALDHSLERIEATDEGRPDDV